MKNKRNDYNEIKKIKEVKYTVSKTSDMNILATNMKIKYDVDMIVNDDNIIKFSNDVLIITFNKI